MNTQSIFPTRIMNGVQAMDLFRSAAKASIPQQRQPRTLAEAGSFLWHLVPMVLAMGVGMAIYHLLLATLLSDTGFAALTSEYAFFNYGMMAAAMGAGMVALMGCDRSIWRYRLEETVTMLGPLAALIVVALCSLLPIKIAHGLGDPLMMVAMGVYLLWHPGEPARGAEETHDLRRKTQ